VSGQFHSPAALPQGKSPPYLLNTTLGGLQSQSGRSGENKIFCLFQESNLCLSARSPVKVLAELSQLLSYSRQVQKVTTSYVTAVCLCAACSSGSEHNILDGAVQFPKYNKRLLIRMEEYTSVVVKHHAFLTD